MGSAQIFSKVSIRVVIWTLDTIEGVSAVFVGWRKLAGVYAYMYMYMYMCCARIVAEG